MPAEQKYLGSGAIGDPPRFTLTRVTRPTFRVAFEYDGSGYDGEEDAFVPERRVAKRTFFSRLAAYRWLARRMIFARRDKFATGPLNAKGYAETCSLCEKAREGRSWASDDIGPECRYHFDFDFRRLESRLARWLMWRDSRRAQ